MKKITIYMIISYFLLQLAVVSYFVYNYFDTLSTGESYKFMVEPYDPYDPFRGRYVQLRPIINFYIADGSYATLEKDSQGFANIISISKEKPHNKQYVKNLRLTRYYMNEKMASEADNIRQELDLEKDIVYLIVKIKNGNYVIQGLYINDIPIEKYIQEM